MIIDTLEKVRDYIVANGLDAGYNVRFFYIDDTRDKGLPVLLIKTSGTGDNTVFRDEVTSMVDGSDFDICLINKRNQTKQMMTTLSAIRELFASSAQSTGLVSYQIQSPVSPPAMMDDDRIMIRFAVRVYDLDAS